MRRLLLLAVTALLVLAASAPVASAASLTATGKDVQEGSEGPLTYSGTADEPSTIEGRIQFDGPACPATPQQFEQEISTGARKRPQEGVASPVVSAAGPFTKSSGYSARTPGRFQVCAWLVADSDKRITAAATVTVTVTALPPDTGCFAKTTIRPGFDVLNSTALQFYAKGGCSNDDSARVAGVATITLRESDRKKLKLKSRTLLKGNMVACGDGGTRCVFFKFDRGIRPKLRAAQIRAAELRRADPLRLRATLRFVMTAPFERTYSAELEFGRNTFVNFSCTSTNPRNPCTDKLYLTGENAGQAPTTQGTGRDTTPTSGGRG